jgi:hypothetical protein
MMAVRFFKIVLKVNQSRQSSIRNPSAPCLCLSTPNLSPFLTHGTMADVSSSSPPTGFGWVDSLFERTHPVGSVYHRINDWRISLELPNPGTTENLGRETKCESFADLDRRNVGAQPDKSDPSLQLPLRWSSGRAQQAALYQPYLPSLPYLFFGISSRAAGVRRRRNVQLWISACDVKGKKCSGYITASLPHTDSHELARRSCKARSTTKGP